MTRRLSYRHAPARPVCGGVGLPLLLIVPAAAVLALLIVVAS